MRHFIIAFSLCLALFVGVNFASYILLSTPTYHRVGFPFQFWTQSDDYTQFRLVRFIVDLGLALYCSYKAGGWWALHCWRKANRTEAA